MGSGNPEEGSIVQSRADKKDMFGETSPKIGLAGRERKVRKKVEVGSRGIVQGLRQLVLQICGLKFKFLLLHMLPLQS